MIYLTGPGTRRPRARRQRLPGGDLLARFTRRCRRTPRACAACSASSRRRRHPEPRQRPTPGSIHEGGELGYVLAHAFGAVFDNPDLIAVAVVGDGEAETGPLEGSWKSVKFLNPARDGAVLPILHLNGYKITGPTVLGRDRDEDVRKLLEGHGYEVHLVEGDDPLPHAPGVRRDARTPATRIASAPSSSDGRHGRAASDVERGRPRWPAIVLRTPKGWTGPKVVDGLPVEGTFRAHQVPLAET